MDVFLYRDALPDLSFMEIRPRDWVVIKPNFIKESKENDPSEFECVITSGRLIEYVCRYVCGRLGPGGRLTICDAPQTDSSFAKIAEKLGLYEIAARCRTETGVTVEVTDLRNEEWTNEDGVIVARRRLPGDPAGVIRFNLGRDSFFHGFRGEGRYYGADYDTRVVNEHHRGDVQEYLVCATPICCDVFINMPKMKTHKKTGVTLNLKNLVGINADKNWLPHYTVGSPRDGGDQFPDASLVNSLEHRAATFARFIALRLPGIGPAIVKRLRRVGTAVFGSGQQTTRSGNWHGNDTTWRMVLDLNRCLLYGNPDGTLREANPKRYYSVVDGVVAMEGAGPLQGTPRGARFVVAGTDPVAVDIVTTRAMGFDWRRLAVMREAVAAKRMPLTSVQTTELQVRSNVPEWNGPYAEVEKAEFPLFEPHPAWKGQVEYRRQG